MTDLEREEKKAAIEAVLFTMGQAVEGDQIRAAIDVSEEEFDDLMADLIRKYAENVTGLQIIRLEDAYQMCTKQAYYDTLIRIAAEPYKPVLTGVMLEVLSIIAYKQPVTRGEIERIRGVSSDYAVNRLLEYGLIEEAGRLEAPGRPILFKTTEEFLRQFGLTSVTELPEISEELLSKAKEDAYLQAGVEMPLSDAMTEGDAEAGAGPDPEDDGPVEVEV